MLIVCPSCASEYALDPSRIGEAGRRVRCASCRESWLVKRPDAAASELAAAIEPLPEAPVALDTPPPAAPLPDALAAPEGDASGGPLLIESQDHVITPSRPRKPKKAKSKRVRRASGDQPARPVRWARRLAIAAAVLAVASIPGALLERAAIVRAVPQAAIVFERLGLPVNLVGLSFAELSSTMAPGDAGATVLLVEGRIENVARRDVDVPRVELTVRGERDEVLYVWSVAAAEARLASGETTRFRARLASPPPAGKRVHITFRAGRTDMKVASR